jgi:hypothetical protein
MVNAFMVTNDEEREFARRQISFYASTPSYRSVLEMHGRSNVGKALSLGSAIIFGVPW